ncbi:hypothetical protein BDZ89DRAFT_1059230 [Hymenopellis radicata]|nr:hypothetical protein BDZ89DRAFT_1059230 [Hymenopellis radicata]
MGENHCEYIKPFLATPSSKREVPGQWNSSTWADELLELRRCKRFFEWGYNERKIQ